MNNYKTILKLFAILILLLVVAHIVCFASFYALTVVGGTPLDLRMFLSIAAGMCVSAVVAFRIHQVHIFKPMVGSILTVATALAAGLSILGWFGMNSEFLVVFGATLASFGLCKKGLTWTNSALSFLAEKKQKEDLRVPSHSVQFLAVLFCAGLGLTGLSTIFIVFGIRAGLTSISVAKLAYVIVFIGSVAIACCVCRGEEYKGVKGTFFTQTLCAAGLLYFVASKAVSFFGIKSGYLLTLVDILSALSVAIAFINLVSFLKKTWNEQGAICFCVEKDAWQKAISGLGRKTHRICEGLLQTEGMAPKYSAWQVLAASIALFLNHKRQAAVQPVFAYSRSLPRVRHHHFRR